MSYRLSIQDRVETVYKIKNVQDADEIFFEHMDLDFHELTSEAVYDAIDKIDSELVYCGDPTELEAKCSDWFDDSIALLQKVFGKNFTVKIKDNTQLISEVYKPIEEVVEYYQGDDQWSINSGKLALVLVTNFLKRGKWQSGFRTTSNVILNCDKNESIVFDNDNNWFSDKYGKLEPIIWFGVQNDKPIECWTIDKSDYQVQQRVYHRSNEVEKFEQWEVFWHSHFRCLDWETIINDKCMLTWMFAECGMDEPEDEFISVVDNCPINLRCQSTKELFESLDNFFLNKLNEN